MEKKLAPRFKKLLITAKTASDFITATSTKSTALATIHLAYFSPAQAKCRGSCLLKGDTGFII